MLERQPGDIVESFLRRVRANAHLAALGACRYSWRMRARTYFVRGDRDPPRRAERALTRTLSGAIVVVKDRGTRTPVPWANSRDRRRYLRTFRACVAVAADALREGRRAAAITVMLEVLDLEGAILATREERRYRIARSR